MAGYVASIGETEAGINKPLNLEALGTPSWEARCDVNEFWNLNTCSPADMGIKTNYGGSYAGTVYFTITEIGGTTGGGHKNPIVPIDKDI